VCYCDDCQSFAHFLEGADRILDAHGGTDIFQLSPAKIEFTQGVEQLGCMRLTPRGMVRWYTACCRTPIGNTPATQGLPFVGWIHLSDGKDLGPVRARVNARFARGDRSQLDAYDRAPFSMIFRFGKVLLGARLRGDGKRSPFFEGDSGKLRVAPHVLSDEELQRVEAARDAWPSKTS
jgi:hypothetical protein